jgi:hypothetical protein
MRNVNIHLKKFSYILVVNIVLQTAVLILAFFPTIISKDLMETMKKDGNYLEFLIFSIILILVKVIIINYLDCNIIHFIQLDSTLPGVSKFWVSQTKSSRESMNYL